MSDRGIKQGSFKFLGFTFYIGKARSGASIVKVKTAKQTFADKLGMVTDWCKKYRNTYRLAVLWKAFLIKVRGHINYYSVTYNFKSVSAFIYRAERIFFKWMNRRSQKKSFNWGKFKLYKQLKPLPKVKVIHRLY